MIAGTTRPVWLYAPHGRYSIYPVPVNSVQTLVLVSALPLTDPVTVGTGGIA